MELYTEILAHYLSQENAQVLFPDLWLDVKEIILQRSKKLAATA